MSFLNEAVNNPPKGGSCVGQKTNMWFPHYKRGSRRDVLIQQRRETRIAISICESCAVAADCLDYSLTHEPWGIWGGKTELERAALRIKKNITLLRDGKIYVPGLGNRNANGDALKLQPKSFLRRNFHEEEM